MAKKEKKESTKLGDSFTSTDSFCEALENKYGSGIVLNNTDKDTGVEFVTSNLISLDNVLGGGLPKGRIIEIFGPESSGKTSLALHNIGITQRLGGACCLVDAEYGFDSDFASALGVNVDSLKVIQPEYGEQALDTVEEMVRSNLFDVIVIDSVAALTPKAEIDGNMGDSHMGLQARLMSQGLRKLSAIVGKTNCRIIFINQLRMKIGIMFGNPETTPGGNALKFYSSIRLDVRRVEFIGNKEMPIGIRQKVKCVKNKVSPPFRQTELNFYFKTGYDVAADIFEQGCNFNIISQEGRSYAFNGNRFATSEDDAIAYIKTNKEIRKDMKQLIRDAFEAQA